MLENVIDKAVSTITRVRSLGFSAEALLLNSVLKMLGHKEGSGYEKLSIEEFKYVRDSVLELFDRDAQAIRKGFIPYKVLIPESPVSHFLRLPRLLLEGMEMGKRKKKGQTTQFDSKAQEFLDEVPKYYQRNFHFQDSGYLSDKSARFYDHQVELLFRGAADAMRRLMLPRLHQRFASLDEGKGLQLLELGAGTGRSTQFVRWTLPRAKMVVTDLSEFYLRVTQEKLRKERRISFMQTDAAKLPFRPESFDCVFSVFMFHEMPEAVRAEVVAEALRVLRPGGYFICVDSLQLGDNPGLDPILKLFPSEFHEPFYQNYINTPVEKILEAAGFQNVGSDNGFVAKVFWGTKN
ncbi:class I SAM-dependent methyltransferase [bacterium]|nr:class I SAM-dependent methyltransferase [bacterium]